MDAKIAIITGTVFAGVLVAGALAAPRSNGHEGNDAAVLAPVTATAADAPLQNVSADDGGAQQVEYYGDDDEYDDDEHDDDHDDRKDRERGHDDDHEEDDD